MLLISIAGTTSFEAPVNNVKNINRSIDVDDASDIHYISSQKGRTLLVHRGFHYVHEKRIRNKVYWRCTQYTTRRKCHGRVHTENGRIVHKSLHNHNANTLMERKSHFRRDN